jgi:uncharacterized membrane protein YkvA (DUF1232 family)
LDQLARLKEWAGRLRRDILALYLAARDPRVPWYAKALAALTAAYALSPIDLIPDFIPVLGHLDDLIIVPAAILLAVRLVPGEVMAELREEAGRRLADQKPRSMVGAAVVLLLWLLLAGLVAWLVLCR